MAFTKGGRSMTRNQRSIVFLLACVAVLALAAIANAGVNARMLAKFQPVTHFDSQEHFRPTGIETFVGDSDLELCDTSGNCEFEGRPAADGSTLPTEGEGWRLNERACVPYASLGGLGCYTASWSAHNASQVVYGRVARLDNRIVLQYWYFYYDNLYSYTHTPSDFIWQSHEGDWEVVNVVLRTSDRSPLYVGYSQHCLGERRAWSDVSRWNGTHPIVYVAAGSHANYLSPGANTIDTRCLPPGTAELLRQFGLTLPVDYADGAGAVSGPAAFGAEQTSVTTLNGYPNWLEFPGSWGEDEWLFSPLGLRRLGTSPVGPAQHTVWTDPLGTLAGWPTG
jgi:hypothetical protein